MYLYSQLHQVDFAATRTKNKASRVSKPNVLRRQSSQSHGVPHSAAPHTHPDHTAIKPHANPASDPATWSFHPSWTTLEHP